MYQLTPLPLCSPRHVVENPRVSPDVAEAMAKALEDTEGVWRDEQRGTATGDSSCHNTLQDRENDGMRVPYWVKDECGITIRGGELT